MALAQVESSSAIMWRLRTGDRIVWSRRVPAGELTPERISVVELPQALPAGQYELSAGDVTTKFEIQAAEEDRILISYNANLSAGAVESLAGRLSLARGDLQSAEQHFRSALALVDLARVQALRGDLDGGRATLLSVLERQPGNADALAALGYISAQLQDYVMAARYFRKAQEIQPSPVLRSALEQALAKSAH
jgi:tetratricopeptide (TPR) repeat protein